jgi:predicted AAA+ superfamily ATPase
MISRDIEATLTSTLELYPVIFLTGPRQSGKSTLLKNRLPDYTYVTLEDPDVRGFALNDPRGFLHTYGDRAIIDEAQRVPELFSYIQTRVDEVNRPGMFVLSGSQNFLLMQAISQSLAVRVGILKLLPFSFK